MIIIIITMIIIITIMIDKMVIQDWVDVKNEYPLIKWLNEIVELHRFSS